MKSRCSLLALVLALLCFSSLADTVLVSPPDSWHYRKGTSAPQADWKTAADAQLDTSWLTGNGGFGYADNAPETQLCQTLLTDMRNSYSTVAVRRTFTVGADPDPNWHLQLTMDFDDGFVAWLDGVYLASENAPSVPAEPAFNALATDSHESSHGNGSANPPLIIDLGPVGAKLNAGTHVLAVLGLNQSLSSSDFVQIPTLSLVTNAPAGGNCLSGLLAVDTVVSLTNSPVTICGDLTVGAGVTLTIAPGVTVQLAKGVNLTVGNGGRLLAEGTETNRIQFVSVPGAGAWGGLTIFGAVDSPETRLAYVDFGGNGKTCIEVNGGTLYLDHAAFSTTTFQYVSLDGSSFLISHCVFPTSSAPFELLHGTGGIKAGGRGIVRDSFFGTTSGYNDIMDFTGGNRPGQPIIQYYNNLFTGATDDILDLDGTDAWIQGNIFLHSHKNGAPDSSAAVSGGNYGSDTSEITMIGNLIFDCDEAATAKQGNFYTLINNTIVHTTKVGGLDTASGVYNVRDLDPGPPTTFGAGGYLEGNVIVDAEQLVRNYDPTQTDVSFVNNILPMPWAGPGQSNAVVDPMLKHIPQVSETQFTNWADAQIMWDWFSLLPGSPALGTGPNGRDKGGVIPLGVSISGEPTGTTADVSATLTVGVNRTGNGIPPSGFPNGSGYTSYKWQLDGGPWSAEAPIGNPIVLTNLSTGSHQVAVVGKNDAGFYQNDPELGTNAVVTLSKVWTVGQQLAFASASRAGNTVTLHFTTQPQTAYTVQFKDSLDAPAWSKLSDVLPSATSQDVVVQDTAATGAQRFYRVVTPIVP